MTKKNTDKKVAGRTEPTNDKQENTALETLKAVADSLGITYSARIGLEALQQKMEEFMVEQKARDEQALREERKQRQALKKQAASKEESEPAKRMRVVQEATRLKRVAVTCMNPNKKDWEGEVITASNSIIPTQKKYIPFNAKPWHVPQIILNVMKERQCQVFKTETRNGRKMRVPYMIPEFAITEMNPLSAQELEDLKKEQAMSNRIND